MEDRGIRRWALLGALVPAALLTPACTNDEWPRPYGEYEGVVNDAQDPETFIDERLGQQQSGVGGSGLDPAGQPARDPLAGIGAPGYSSPREFVPGDQFYVDPQPGLDTRPASGWEEPGGADRAGEQSPLPRPDD